jgi:hypothetical protein
MGGRAEMRGVYLPSHLERTPKICTVRDVNIVKGVGRAPRTLTNISIMMECKPEIGRCHYVYILCGLGLSPPGKKSDIYVSCIVNMGATQPVVLVLWTLLLSQRGK